MPLTPHQQLWLSYFRGLILAGKPYIFSEACREFDVGESVPTRAISTLRRIGAIRIEKRAVFSRTVVRITIEGVGSTPWPTREQLHPISPIVERVNKYGLHASEIEARRKAIERERMQRRTAHLMAERRPKQRTAASTYDGAEAAIARAYGF